MSTRASKAGNGRAALFARNQKSERPSFVESHRTCMHTPGVACRRPQYNAFAHSFARCAQSIREAATHKQFLVRVLETNAFTSTALQISDKHVQFFIHA